VNGGYGGYGGYGLKHCPLTQRKPASQAFPAPHWHAPPGAHWSANAPTALQSVHSGVLPGPASGAHAVGPSVPTQNSADPPKLAQHPLHVVRSHSHRPLTQTLPSWHGDPAAPQVQPPKALQESDVFGSHTAHALPAMLRFEGQ
jgi:hypothetical protein